MTKTEIEAIEIAALLNNADAQCQLGRLFQNGDGVPKDLRESYKWFLEAAGRGHCNAMYQLGLCYQFGHGITKDIEKAVEWFKKAAAKGHSAAKGQLDRCYDEMYSIGRCYATGDGRTKNLAKAASWFAKAECGSMKARRALFALQNPNLMKPCTLHYLSVRIERRDYSERDYEGRYSVGRDYIVLYDGTIEFLRRGRYPENIDRQTLDEEDIRGLGHFRREGGRFGSFPE